MTDSHAEPVVTEAFSDEELQALGDFALGQQHRALSACRAVLGWRNIASGTGSVVLIVLVSGGLFAASAIAARYEGRLGPAPGTLPQRALHNAGPEQLPVAVPLLRDYAYLVIVLLAGFAAATFAREWNRLDRLPEVFARGGLLRTDRVPATVFLSSFRRLQRLSSQTRWEVISLVATLFVVALVAWSVLQEGVYTLIDPYGASHPSGGSVQLDKWWASPNNSVAAFSVMLLTVAAYMYLTIRNTILGLHVLLWFRHMRAAARLHKKDDWFGYSDPWCAYEEPLTELRRALVDLFVVVLIGAIAGAAAVYALALPPQMLVVLMAYLLYNIAIFIVPWKHFTGQLSRSKNEMRDSLAHELDRLTNSPRKADREKAESVWLTYTRTGEFPDRAIEWRFVGALIALYLIPILGLLPAYRR